KARRPRPSVRWARCWRRGAPPSRQGRHPRLPSTGRRAGSTSWGCRQGSAGYSRERWPRRRAPARPSCIWTTAAGGWLGQGRRGAIWPTPWGWQHVVALGLCPAVATLLRRYASLHPMLECAARALGLGVVEVIAEGADGGLRTYLNRGQRLPAVAGGA